MKKGYAFLVFACIMQLSFAAIQPSWKLAFNNDVNWQKVTNLGYLIVNTPDGLFGIDPEKGETMWNIKELGTLPSSSFEPVTGTQFFKITTMSGETAKVRIINPIDGKTLFNSADEGVNKLLSYHTLAQSNQLLVVAIKTGNSSASLLMYDIENGTKLWDNDELFKVEVNTGLKGGLGSFANKLASDIGSSMNAMGLTSEPVELDAETMILAHPNFIYSIKTVSGEANWKFAMQSSTASNIYFKGENKDVIYVSTEVEEESSMTSSSSSTGEPTIYYYNLIYALDAAKGTNNWKEPFKAKGQINTVIMEESGIIVCPRASKPAINLIDYATGTGQWGKKGKGVKIKGTMVSYEAIDGQYAITTGFDNAFTNAGEEYYLNVLDPKTGALKFDKYEKLKGDLRKTELVDKGMLYITSREVNILDLSTGENVFPKSIEAAKPLDPAKYDPAKHGLPIDEKGDILYVFSSKDNVLYEVNKKAATQKALSGKISFEGKEEPTGVEIVEDGILLISDQNIMKLDKAGKQVYHSYFPAPKLPGLMKALHAANAVRAAYISVGAAAYSAAFADAAANADDALTQEVAGAFSEGYGELSKQGVAVTKQSAEMVFKRFKASSQSPNYVFILSEPEKKHYYIYQVNKADGQKAQEIDLAKDREPSYEVDQVYSYIYYRLGDKEIVCYKFK